MVVGIIPAKGESRGILNKNKRPFGGDRPLVEWTLLAANSCSLLDAVAFTSEDGGLIRMASDYPVSIFERPPALAGDHAQVDEVVLFTLREMQHIGLAPDLVVVLQPTSPFRFHNHIDEAIQQYYSINSKGWPYEQNHSVFSAYQPEKYHYQMVGATAEPIGHNPEKRLGRQDTDPVDLAMENGAIYVVDAQRLSDEGTFRAMPMSPYFMDRMSSLEIDSEEDWMIGEAYVKYYSEMFD